MEIVLDVINNCKLSIGTFTSYRRNTKSLVFKLYPKYYCTTAGPCPATPTAAINSKPSFESYTK